jgi:hypothetical protein
MIRDHVQDSESWEQAHRTSDSMSPEAQKHISGHRRAIDDTLLLAKSDRRLQESCMSKKTLILVAFLFNLFLSTTSKAVAQDQSGEIKTTVRDRAGSQQINVPEGSVFEVITFTSEGNETTYYGGRSILSVSKDGKDAKFAFSKSGYANDLREVGGKIAGPATVTFESQGMAMLSYRLVSNTTAQLSAVPTSSVVIPANASGPVSIVLESSVDMVTWTLAQPGSYGASTEKRFFRIRAVQN